MFHNYQEWEHWTKKNNIPIEDELWFCYYHGYKRKWVLDDDEIEKKSWEEKFFLQNSDHTVFTMNGLALPDAKPLNQFVYSKYFVKNELVPQEQNIKVSDAKKHNKIFYVHF